MGGALTLLAVAFVSALVPVVNLEIYLGGMALLGHSLGAWELAALAGIAAVGHIVGKTLFYFGGRGVLTATRWHRVAPTGVPDGSGSTRRTRVAGRKTRIAARLSRWEERVRERPRLAVVLVGTSSCLGLPPFALVSVAAGTLRVPLPVFLLAGLAGRWARFAAVLALVQVSGS